VEIIVLIKQVPDTATRIQDRVKAGQVDLDGVSPIVNPYDEYAVEEALRIKERVGGTVTLIAFGPPEVDKALKDMLALGADEGVHVWDPSFAGLDARGVAHVLAAAVRKVPHQMVWTGWKGVDYDEGLVPIFVAHELGYPHVSFVSAFDLDGDRATVRRDVEGGREVLSVGLPALFTAQKGLNEIRYASLKGIMAVKRKVIPTWDASALGLAAADLPAPMVQTVRIERPPDRPPGRLVPGATSEAADELVRLLHEEAKVI
jgi:electron transfer flavoprotein beta subunit